MEKTCTKCLEVKVMSDFHRNYGSEDGYQYWCKECHRKHTKAVRDKNKARHLAAEGRTEG